MQLLEELKYFDKWILPQNEVQRRKELVNKTIAFWKFTKAKDFLEESSVNLNQMLDLAINLKPIKDEWLENYIEGWVYKASPLIKYNERADKLMESILIIISLFWCTKNYQNYFINRNIPENETLTTEFDTINKLTNNAREVIKKLVKDKKIILVNNEQIDRLKLKYLLKNK